MATDTTTTAQTVVPASSGIVLHWLEESRAHRILWLLEELKLSYAIKLYKRDPKTHLADPALKKVHPLGKSPVLEDNGKVIAESGLIIDYLVSKYGANTTLAPKTDEDAFQVKYFLHFGEASLQPAMLLLYVTENLRKAPAPFFVRPIVRKIADTLDKAYAGPESVSQLNYLESILEKNGTGYFVGADLTGADIILVFPLSMAISRAGLSERNYPLLWKWLQDVRAREAYVAADKRIAIEAAASGVKL